WAELAEALSGASAEEETEEDEEGSDEPDLDALAEEADVEGDDSEAASAIATYIVDNDLEVDPDEFDTWVEVVAAIREAGGEEGGEEDVPDYDAMSPVALKKLAKERGLPTAGTKEELIERMVQYDETDPFKE